MLYEPLRFYFVKYGVYIVVYPFCIIKMQKGV